MVSVIVMMSTYNGEKYLKEQLDSILNQEGVQVTLEIRDDGSTDSTKLILANYSETHRNIHVEFGENIGFACSFLKLLYSVGSADYYAFSDQDDVWYVDKLSSAVEKMTDIMTPTFYFAAQDVVDEHLTKLRVQSFRKMLKYSKYSATMVPLSRGCVQVWNRAFQEYISLHIVDYSEFYSHDTWVNLLAYWGATILYDDVPHMAYRQTGNNVMGGYRNFYDRIIYIYKKGRTYLIKKQRSKEICAKALSAFYMKERILTSCYRDSIRLRLRLLFDKKYKKGLDLKWRLFNDVLVLLGRL